MHKTQTCKNTFFSLNSIKKSLNFTIWECIKTLVQVKVVNDNPMAD